MIKNNKKLIIILILIIFVSLFGISYAYYVYSNTGLNNQLIVGNVYMHSRGTGVSIDTIDVEYEIESVYYLNATNENINACVEYLYNTYGESWNGMVDEGDNSGPVSEKYIPKNIIPKFIDNIAVTNYQPTYYEYCSNNYSYSGGDGDPGGGLMSNSIFNYKVLPLSSYVYENAGPYYNLIINDYLNGVMSATDKAYFRNNNIIIDNLTTIPYYEFTIDGRNTYKEKDVYYDINLVYGDIHATRTERVRDELLKFSLVEIVDGEPIFLFQNRTYDTINNKRIWVDTISSTDGVVNRTYRLYMSFIDDIHVGDLETSDYDLDTWSNQVYASVKVLVTGDFTEKNIVYNENQTASDDSCFTMEEITVYSRNTNMTTEQMNTCVSYAESEIGDHLILNPNISSNSTILNACVNYLTTLWGPEVEGDTVDVGETYQAFCNGTGTFWGATFQHLLDINDFSSSELDYFEENNIIVLEDKTSKAEAFCNGTGTIDGFTFQAALDSGYLPEEFYTNGIIVENNYNAITSYDPSCGSEVVIPSSLPINSYSNATLNSPLSSDALSACVTYFTYFFRDWKTGETAEAFCNGTGTNWGNTFQEFLDNGWFNSLALDYFYENDIITATVSTNTYPVTGINSGAFLGIDLTKVIFPNTIRYIGPNAFVGNRILTVNVPSTVESSLCGVFDMGVVINTNQDLVCRYEFSNTGGLPGGGSGNVA